MISSEDRMKSALQNFKRQFSDEYDSSFLQSGKESDEVKVLESEDS